MDTRLCLMIGLALVIVAPVASADPDPFGPGHDVVAEPLCVDVDLSDIPPVDIYECPWTGP